MNNRVLLILVALLLLICAYLGYQVYQGNQTIEQGEIQLEEVSTDRDQVKLELEKMMFSYDTLSTENAYLMAEMAAQRTQIEDLLTKVKDRNWSISKLKKETNTLRDIMKGYIVTIDSLNQLNDSLRFENQGLQENIAAVQGRNEELTQRQENMETMIATGQILQATTVIPSAIRLTNSGSQKETNRANKADMIKTCFVLMENKIAKPGNRELYMRIIGPDGKVLPTKDGAAKFAFAGGEDYYSVSRPVDYNNAQMEVCVFYDVQNELEKGDYTLFLYEGPNQIGTTSLALR